MKEHTNYQTHQEEYERARSRHIPNFEGGVEHQSQTDLGQERSDVSDNTKESFTSSNMPKTVNIWLLSIVYFTLCTIIFLVSEAMYSDHIVNIVFNHQDPSLIKLMDTEGVDHGNYSIIWDKIEAQLTYIRVIIFGVLACVLYLTNYGFLYKVYLGGTQDHLAFQILFICFFTILGIMFLLCNNTSFVKIFENTIGYAFVSSFYNYFSNGNLNLDQAIQKVLKNTDTNKFGIHYDFLFTIFRLDNFGSVLREIKAGNEDSKNQSNEPKYPFDVNLEVFDGLDKNENDLKHLFRLVFKKNMIGHLCWVFFGAMTSTLVASKYLAKYL